MINQEAVIQEAEIRIKDRKAKRDANLKQLDNLSSN